MFPGDLNPLTVRGISALRIANRASGRNNIINQNKKEGCLEFKSMFICNQQNKGRCIMQTRRGKPGVSYWYGDT